MQKSEKVGTSWYSINKEDIFKELNTSELGLKKEQVKINLKKYGKNVIKKTHKLRPLKIFFQQFNSFFIYILIVATIVSFLINNFVDGIVIFIIIILNSIIGFFQQYKAEKAIINLKKMIIPKSRVIRNGKVSEINSSELVPGDIILLSSGDKISADSRIIEEENLQTNESILTGESLPINKFSKSLSQNTILSKRFNMLFAGTQIVRGNSKAVVVNTGMNTVFGKIAESLQEIKIQKTPIQKKLDKLSKQIGIFILFFVGIVMILGISDHFNSMEMFLTAVALAVSAIPEGLPAVLTISFAISSLIMSKQNVVIRRLPAVESLGSISVICSDKTGTITEEKMDVREIFSNNNFYSKKGKKIFLNNKEISIEKNKELSQLFKTSILCNNARFEFTDEEKENYTLIGDPTEETLLSASLDLGLNKKIMTKSEPKVSEFEFNSKRKMMSIFREVDNGRKRILYSKGAPEKIIAVSSFELVNGQIRKLTNERKIQLINSSKKMESDALRVLGFAYKNFSLKEKPKEKALIFVGFIGMIDPPRPEVKDAITQCKNAGIKVKIITGDSAVTAMAIAKQIGIVGKIIVEEELEKMSDEELTRKIDDIVIFARTTPHQKLRITNILQKKGEVVAITGDGINDALALKSADVGIAMGKRGTDVSRDVSDVVLIDDNFASIIEGIKEGRKSYDNIKKFIKYMFAVNFSGIFLILFSLLMAGLFTQDKWFLPLLPLQILWVNLITDSLPALSLVLEKQEDVMNSKPRTEKSILSGIWKFIIIAGIFTVSMKIIVYVFGVIQNFPAEKTRTIVLTTVILFEMFFVYTCRSDKSLFKIGIFSNKWLNYSVLFSIFLHFILLYTPLANVFGVVPLTLKEWIFILPFALSGVVVFEVKKIIDEKRKSKKR